eukprot:scaffold120_cov59-Cylindrotheca_fusiformis.AAC.1
MQHPEEVEDGVWIYYGLKEYVPRTVRRVKIAESVTEIPDETFRERRQLEEVVLSSSVRVIGKWAFFRCKELKSILYQGLEKEEVGFPPNVKVIEDGAFQNCTLLARLVLNEGPERIGRYAFNACASLTEVDIPSTVKVIEWGAFQECKLLARLGLNEGLERIGENSFHGCESLTEVNVPSTVKVIDFRAFLNCKLLTILVLNEGLERIGTGAFELCKSLSHVTIPQSVNSIGYRAFTKCSNLISIELPEELFLNIHLSGCLSLVSLVAGPKPTFRSRLSRLSGEAFFQSSKLGSLVDNEADLIPKLNHRFDNSPLNRLCYYQAYQSSDDAMAELRSLMEEYSPLAATTEVDEFGMTPLH